MWIDGKYSFEFISQHIGLSFRICILLVALWAIFFRRARSTLPIINLLRSFLFFVLAVMITFAWMFYVIKFFKENLNDYNYVLNHAVSTLDCLIFLHYLAFLLLELKPLKKEFVIRVVRNTDGESHLYSVGHMSIKDCAAWVLENYYTDFLVYKPHLMTLPSAKAKSSEGSTTQGAAKEGQVISGGSTTQNELNNNDGGAVAGDAATVLENTKAMIANSARDRDAGRNRRFYEEEKQNLDYERRLLKRRVRFVVAVEKAFMHVKRPDATDNDRQLSPLDAHEAAQAIFPSMARAMQKYLKISRQAHCYSLRAVIIHLARCITLDYTPRAFLENYLTPGPVITSEKENDLFQNWELITDTIANRGINSGIVFQLKQDKLSLVVFVTTLPRFYIRDKAVDPSRGQFVLRLPSET